ncbi:hypothetical protein DT076_15620 [Desertihabitans brevis]|uniref:Uncharacterized protein n=1 Tax=Desertihabitans brevis TaxID=2268447 RepID=A0A367YSX1_9ACTN|nr:hypothetical protein DT076_15620 [Desertihabitans brevis]
MSMRLTDYDPLFPLNSGSTAPAVYVEACLTAAPDGATSAPIGLSPWAGVTTDGQQVAARQPITEMSTYPIATTIALDQCIGGWMVIGPEESTVTEVLYTSLENGNASWALEN